MTRTIAALAFIAFAGIALAGPPAPAVASCNVPAAGWCNEFRNHTASALEFNKASCARTTGGTWSDGKGCPAEKRVARCSLKLLESEVLASYYPPKTLKDAKEACAAGAMQMDPN